MSPNVTGPHLSKKSDKSMYPIPNVAGSSKKTNKQTNKKTTDKQANGVEHHK